MSWGSEPGSDVQEWRVVLIKVLKLCASIIFRLDGDVIYLVSLVRDTLKC
jgi:hypothetical protein